MKDIQKGICQAYREPRPLKAGRFPASRYAIYHSHTPTALRVGKQ